MNYNDTVQCLSLQGMFGFCDNKAIIKQCEVLFCLHKFLPFRGQLIKEYRKLPLFRSLKEFLLFGCYAGARPRGEYRYTLFL